MSKQLTFNQATENNFKTLVQYVPIVARVHGGNHPEFLEVRKFFDAIIKKTKEAGVEKPELNEKETLIKIVLDKFEL